MAKKEGIKRVATEITRMMKNASIKEVSQESFPRFAPRTTAVNKAYIYFSGSRATGKVLTEDNVSDDFDLLEKSIFYEGNENAEIIKAGFEMIVVMVPVSSKVITENLEFILMERYKWRITNCNHDKCSMKQTCLLNSINACAIVDTKF